MSMNQIVELCTTFHSTIYERMFITPIVQAVTSPLEKKRIARQIEELADAAAESLSRFFESKQFSPSQVAAILKGLKSVLAKRTRADFRNPSAIPDAVAREFLAKKRIPVDVKTAGHESTYRVAFSMILRVLILAAPTLAEYEKVKFPREFEKIRVLVATIRNWAEQLETLSAKGNFSRDTSFEHTYRNELLQRAYRVDVGAMRVGPTQAVDIRDLFVRPKLIIRREQLKADEEATAVSDPDCVESGFLTLQAARNSIFSDRRDVGSDKQEDPRLDAVEFLRERRRVVLVGLPGGGKSTLVEWLQVQLAAGEFGCLGDDDPAPVPMLLRVRQFKDGTPPSTAEFVSRTMHSGDWAQEMPQGWTERFLALGRVLLIVDGLDESTTQNRIDRLLPWLEDIIRTFPRTRIVVTSRPAGYPPGWLTELGFTECDLAPFDGDQALEFAQHWHIARMLAENKPLEEAKRDGEEAGSALHTSFTSHPHVRDLAQSPLMLAAICLVHHFEGGRLPDDRALLYKLCVEGLLHNWDQGRGIQTGFPLEEKLRVCRHLAIQMQQLATAEATLQFVQHSFEAELGDAQRAVLLLEHIRERAGVLIERRTEVFAFAHLTFQEYLAAVAIQQGGTNIPDALDIARQSEDPRWREVIPLFCGVTTRSGAESMLRTLAEQPPHSHLSEIICEAYGTAAREVGRDSDLHDLVAAQALSCQRPYPLPRLEVFRHERLLSVANRKVAMNRNFPHLTVAFQWLAFHPSRVNWDMLEEKWTSAVRLDPYALCEVVYLIARFAQLGNRKAWSFAIQNLRCAGPRLGEVFYPTQANVAFEGLSQRFADKNDAFANAPSACSKEENEYRQGILTDVLTSIQNHENLSVFSSGVADLVIAVSSSDRSPLLTTAYEVFTKLAGDDETAPLRLAAAKIATEMVSRDHKLDTLGDPVVTNSLPISERQVDVHRRT